MKSGSKKTETQSIPCKLIISFPTCAISSFYSTNANSPHSFGIGIRDHSRPQFASGLLLAIIAISQGTINGIHTLEDLAQMELQEGEDEIPLSWRHDAMEKPVFRNVTAQGAQDLTLTTERFCYFLRQIFRKSNYSKDPKIHDIHRALGKKVDGMAF